MNIELYLEEYMKHREKFNEIIALHTSYGFVVLFGLLFSALIHT